MKRGIVNMISVAIGIAGFLSAAVSGWYLYKTEAAVTEAALSLAGAEIERCIEEKCDGSHVKNYLAFADLNEASKEKLLLALSGHRSGLQSIAAQLSNFSYSREALKQLEMNIDALGASAAGPARLDADMEDARISEAKKLLSALFGSKVNFKEQDGDGILFLKRYYCANICLDVCMNGTLRYLCYLDSAENGDRFFEYYFKPGHYRIEEKKRVGMFECSMIVSDTHRAVLYIDAESGHTVAAKIETVS